MKSLIFASIALATSSEEVKEAEFWPGLIGNPAIDWTMFEAHLHEFQSQISGKSLSSEYIAAFAEHFADFAHSLGKNKIPDPECLLDVDNITLKLSNGVEFPDKRRRLEPEFGGHGKKSPSETCDETCDEADGTACVQEDQLTLDQNFSSCECMAARELGQEFVPRISDPELPAGCIADVKTKGKGHCGQGAEFGCRLLADGEEPIEADPIEADRHHHSSSKKAEFIGFVWNELKKSPQGCAAKFDLADTGFAKVCVCGDTDS